MIAVFSDEEEYKWAKRLLDEYDCLLDYNDGDWTLKLPRSCTDMIAHYESVSFMEND